MLVCLKEGLHEGVPHEFYHSDPSEKPSLSSHVAQVLLAKSAAHAKLIHPRFGGQRGDSSDAMDAGSLLHAFLLGGGSDIVEFDAADWRTNAAKAKREEAYAAGMLPVLAHKLADIKAAVPRVKAALPFDLSTAKTELTALWESGGCPCRCRLDALMPDLWIWDLKFAEDAMLSSQDRNIEGSGYHVQAAANIDGIETSMEGAAGRVHFGLCFVEWKNPEIGIIRKEIRGQLLDVGQRKWNRAKGIWAQSLKSGQFPGYCSDVVAAECPPWVAAQDLEQQIANNEGKEPF
jgi:hypothetical protein